MTDNLMPPLGMGVQKTPEEMLASFPMKRVHFFHMTGDGKYVDEGTADGKIIDAGADATGRFSLMIFDLVVSDQPGSLNKVLRRGISGVVDFKIRDLAADEPTSLLPNGDTA